MTDSNSPSRRRQFSLAFAFVVLVVWSILLGIGRWLHATIPAILAAAVVLCWTCGLVLFYSASVIRLDRSPASRRIVIGLVLLGGLIAFFGPLLAVGIWARWSGNP